MRGSGGGHVDKKNERNWSGAGGDRLLKNLQKWVWSTPSHYGNSALSEADVRTNGCGRGKEHQDDEVTEYRRGIGNFCVPSRPLFRCRVIILVFPCWLSSLRGTGFIVIWRDYEPLISFYVWQVSPAACLQS